MAGKPIALTLTTTANYQFGPIQYGEREGYSENWTGDPNEVHRTLICNWTDARNFPIAVLGDVRINPDWKGVADQVNVPLNRILPMAHPHADKNLFAVECNLRNGIGAYTANQDTGLIMYGDLVNGLDGVAEWDVIYRNLPYDAQPDKIYAPTATVAGELFRYVERVPGVSTETYTLPGNTFVWGSDQKPIPENAVKHRPLLALKYTWHWVPEQVNPPACLYSELPGTVPAGAAGVGVGAGEVLSGPLLGRVNGYSFDGGVGIVKVQGALAGVKSTYKTYDAFHLLLNGFEASDRVWTASGQPCRHFTYTFAFRPDSTWNHLYRARIDDFDSVQPRPAFRGFQRGVGPVSIDIPPIPAGKYQPYRFGNFGYLFYPI